MTGRRRWRVRLSASAETDFRSILRWTAQRFGEAQANAYQDVLADAIAALADGPEVPGARKRDDIARGEARRRLARGHGQPERIARRRRTRRNEELAERGRYRPDSRERSGGAAPRSLLALGTQSSGPVSQESLHSMALTTSTAFSMYSATSRRRPGWLPSLALASSSSATILSLE